MPYGITLTLGDYVKERPGESTFRRHNLRDNPKEFYEIEESLFYQENETEALMFIVGKNKTGITTVWISIHLTLDLAKKEAYMDDIYSMRYDYEDEYVDSGNFLVENDMYGMEFLFETIQYHYLGDRPGPVLARQPWRRAEPDRGGAGGGVHELCLFLDLRHLWRSGRGAAG